MQNESNAAEQLTDGSNTRPANSDVETEDVMEKRLPIADGGFGPLDSDDIEWLIESGTVWMP